MAREKNTPTASKTDVQPLNNPNEFDDCAESRFSCCGRISINADTIAQANPRLFADFLLACREISVRTQWPILHQILDYVSGRKDFILSRDNDPGSAAWPMINRRRVCQATQGWSLVPNTVLCSSVPLSLRISIHIFGLPNTHLAIASDVRENRHMRFKEI